MFHKKLRKKLNDEFRQSLENQRKWKQDSQISTIEELKTVQKSWQSQKNPYFLKNPQFELGKMEKAKPSQVSNQNPTQRNFQFSNSQVPASFSGEIEFSNFPNEEPKITEVKDQTKSKREGWQIAKVKNHQLKLPSHQPALGLEQENQPKLQTKPNRQSKFYFTENKPNRKKIFIQFSFFFLVFLIVIGIIFGGYQYWQSELLKSQKIALECQKTISQISKNKQNILKTDLEKSLDCQKVEESFWGVWQNQNLDENLAQNKAKIEESKKNLTQEINQLSQEIETKISQIESLELTNENEIIELKKPDPNFNNFQTDLVEITDDNFILYLETKAEKQAKLSKINSIFLANIEQKFKTLNQIIKENSDLSAELNLEEYQNYLNKISQEINFENSENSKTQNDNQNNKNIDFLIGNTSDLPDYSKTPNTLKNSLTNSQLDLVEINQTLTDKIQDLTAKVDMEITKNPAKARERMVRLYKNFNGVDFNNVFNSLSYPKVGAKTDEVVILGNPKADEYIVKVAEKRGYSKRAQADETKLEQVQGQKLQTEAKIAFEELQKEAKKEGLEMVLVSGYRSFQEQKDIFLSRLGNLATAESIASGQSDEVLDKLLQTTSIPGYSRHHTGYTFDLGCASTELTIFKDTKCYEWLSRDNYLNAKRFGLIPSYPVGGGVQGPDPEAWEYIWVGQNLLRKNP